jgi:hypothetical protein
MLITLEFSRQIFEKYANIKFRKNPSSDNRVVACGRTEGQDWRTDMTKLRVAFGNFANAPKNDEELTFCRFFFSLHMKTNCHCAPRRCICAPRNRIIRWAAWERRQRQLDFRIICRHASPKNRITVLAAGLLGAKWHRNCRNVTAPLVWCTFSVSYMVTEHAVRVLLYSISVISLFRVDCNTNH